MKKIITLALIAASLLSAPLLQAQAPGGKGSPMNAAMMKMLGKNTNFTATASVKMLDKSQGETTMDLSMAILDGKMRSEIDMAKMKGKMMSPEMVAQMQQMGMDKTVYIVRPDQNVTYAVYPGMKSYLRMPIPKADQDALTKPSKVTTTNLGKETVDGHPCVKNKMVVTDEKGQTQDALVWNATDMKDFPIQMQMKEGSSTVTMLFKNVQFAKPDAKQFEPPTDYAKFDNMQQLQQAMMQRMLGKP